MSTPPKAKPSRLGRGLSSLISVSDLPIEMEMPSAPPAGARAFSTDPVGEAIEAPGQSTPAPVTPSDILIADIAPNPHQPRKHFDEASIQALAASLKSTGLVQPIVVRPVSAADGQVTYQLIAGERRLRAAKAAGLTTIPAILREVDPFVQAQMALIENIQREDLNPIDRAQAYRALIDQLSLTQSELALRLGEERSSIANYLRLLELAEPVCDLIRQGDLTLGHAKIVAGIGDLARQTEVAQKVVGESLSVRALEQMLQSPPAAPGKSEAKQTSAHVRDLEKNITSTLGMKVQLRSSAKKGKGKLVIHYSTLDQFDHLLERLGVKID